MPVGKHFSLTVGTLGQVEVTIEMLMEGGGTYTYLDCVTALKTLIGAAQSVKDVEDYPSQIVVSEGGHRKIRCTVSLFLNGLTKTIRYQGSSSVLKFVGTFTPTRILPSTAVRAALAAARREAQQAGSAVTVPSQWITQQNYGGVEVAFQVSISAHDLPPPFTFADITRLFDAVLAFYVRGGRWGILWGDAMYQAGLSQEFDIGYFSVSSNLDNDFSEPNTTANVARKERTVMAVRGNGGDRDLKHLTSPNV